MLNGTVLSTTQKYYYPLGNTPPVCLTQDLASEEDAAILCMECGDARNILFTCFADASRKIDVTCVDPEPGVLARNVLLFTLLVDDKANANVERIFNIYYHWKLDRSSAELLEKQTSKLVTVSSSLDKWHGSAYGHYIRFADARSLYLVRVYWRGFQLQGIARKQKEERLYQLQCTINEAKYHHFNKKTHNIDHRSASLVGMQAGKDIMDITRRWWNTGTLSICNATELNPAFLFSPNEKLMLYYNLSPVCGFPIETAYFPIAKESVFHIERRDDVSSSNYLVNSVKSHFKEWAAAFRKSVKNKSIIRIFCGNALNFGFTLHNCQITGSLSMNLFCDNLTSSPLLLSNDYGKNKDAPTSFDIIDVSSLADRLGLLNVIGMASSLLKCHASSSIYAEVSLQRDENLSDQLSGFFGIDVATISLLLGLVLPELFTNTTHSPVDASVLAKFPKTVDGVKVAQFCSRLRWKRLRGESCDVPNIQISAKVLAKILIQIHNAMFTIEEDEEEEDDSDYEYDSDDSDDILAAIFGFKTRRRRRKFVSPKHVITYSRASFAFFLNRVKATIISDWNECFKHIHKKCLSSRSLAFVMSDFVQDLLLNLRFFGVDNGAFIKPTCSEVHNAVLAPILPVSKTDIPELLCVTVHVPKKRLETMEPEELGSSDIICSLEGEGEDGRPWTSVFSTVHVTFGTWQRQTSKIPHPYIVEDPAGYSGTSGMYVSFFVPTWVLLTSKFNVPTVTCELMSDQWDGDSDQDTFFMYSKMTGKDVFITRFIPGMSAIPTFSRPNEPTSITTTVQCTYGDLKISTVTRRVTVECPEIKAKLADKSSAINVAVVSPLTTIIDFPLSEKIKFELPLPLSFSQPTIRIARTSAYVEVESRLFDPLNEDASIFMFPMIMGSTSHTLWTSTRLNLDLMPPVGLNDNRAICVLTTHASLMFSNREQVIFECRETNDTRMSFKSGLVTIFKEYMNGSADVFKLSKMNGEVQTLILPSCVRLDLVNHTVVLDAAIIPLTHAISSDERVKSLLRELTSNKVFEVKIFAAEDRAWKAALPAMVERCRLWNHNTNCEYLSTDNTSPICSCGQGKFPTENYLKPQMEKFTNLSYVVSMYGTRAAIAPVFGVSYVEPCYRKSEVNNNINNNSNINNKNRKTNGFVPKEKCAKCNGDIRDLKQCSRCKEVSYCSKVCKEAHYRKHKPHCKAA